MRLTSDKYRIKGDFQLFVYKTKKLPNIVRKFLQTISLSKYGGNNSALSILQPEIATMLLTKDLTNT